MSEIKTCTECGTEVSGWEEYEAGDGPEPPTCDECGAFLCRECYEEERGLCSGCQKDAEDDDEDEDD